MGIAIKRNRIEVDEDELDIYAATELSNALKELYDKGKKKVTLDLGKVERVSTPAIQVILSARKSFNEFHLESLQESVAHELKTLGIEF